MSDEQTNSIKFTLHAKRAKRKGRTKRFEHCSIHAARNWYDLSFGPEKLRVSFQERGIDDRWLILQGEEKIGFRSFAVTALDSERVSANANNWLSVLFGEDMFMVRETPKRQNPSLRGRLIYSQEYALNFMQSAFEWTTNELTDAWRAEVLNSALGCFHIAIQGGVNHTPITQSLFLTCLENLANVRNFDPTTHRKSKQDLGPKSFFDPTDKDDRALLADLNALIAIRDITGAHFGAHQEREREKLTKALRASMGSRGIYTAEFVEMSYQADRILDDIHREARWLYLVGLNLCRQAFARLIGAWGVLTAEKDLWPLVFEAEKADYHDPRAINSKSS